jgi:hypothetical protein
VTGPANGTQPQRVQLVLCAAAVPADLLHIDVRGLLVHAKAQSGLVQLNQVLPVRPIDPPMVVQLFTQLLLAGCIEALGPNEQGQVVWQRAQPVTLRLCAPPQGADAPKLIMPAEGGM